MLLPRRLLHIWLLLLALCLAGPVLAREAAAAPAFSLTRLAGMPAGATVEDAQARTPEQLQPVDAARLTLPADAELWLQLRITEAFTADEPLVLSVQGLRYSRATLYGPDGQRPVTRGLSADADPRFSRHALSFTLPAQLQAGETWYLRFHRHGLGTPSIKASLALAPLAEVNASGLRHARIVMASVGTLAAVFALLLLLWWRRREPALAYGALCWGTCGLYIAFFFGEGFAVLPFVEDSAWSLSAYVLPGTLSAGASQLMYRAMLDTPRHAPRLATLMVGVACYFFVAAVIGLPASSSLRGMVVDMTNLLIVPGSLVTLTAVVIALRHGVPGSGLLLASWLMGALPLMWRAVTLLAGQEARGSALYYATPMGLALGGVLAVCALLERSSQRQPQRRRARAAPAQSLPAALPAAQALRQAAARAARGGLPLAVIALRLHRPRTGEHHAPAWHWPTAFDLVRARLLHDAREAMDVAAGDEGELIALLPGADGLTAEAIAQRWVAALRAQPLRLDAGPPLALDPDAGVAWARITDAPDAALLQQARAALAMSAADPARGVVSLAA